MTWGTNPAMTVDVTGVVPESRGCAVRRAGGGPPRSEVHGAGARHADQRRSRSTSSSSARAPTAGSKTCEPRPGSSRAERRAAGAGACRARQRGCPPSGRGRGAGPHLSRGRRRVAAGGMQHVPGHESRQAQARPALGQHQQPQLRGPPGPRRPHPPGQPGHGRRRRRHRPFHRCRASIRSASW